MAPSFCNCRQSIDAHIIHRASFMFSQLQLTSCGTPYWINVEGINKAEDIHSQDATLRHSIIHKGTKKAMLQRKRLT